MFEVRDGLTLLAEVFSSTVPAEGSMVTLNKADGSTCSFHVHTISEYVYTQDGVGGLILLTSVDLAVSDISG